MRTRSMCRRLTDNIHWLSNEESMIYYMDQLTESVWPKGQLGGAWPTRTLEQRESLKTTARTKLVTAVTGLVWLRVRAGSRPC